MADYTYPQDGKFHTRYSELVACTSDRVAVKVAEQRAGLRPRVETEVMRFGTDRHNQFAQESRKTGLTPQVFKDELGFQLEVIEVEVHRATELFQNCVIHFTMDAHCKPADSVDYKTTTTDGMGFVRSYQQPIYCLLMGPHGDRIERLTYLIERWNKERDSILGYDCFTREISIKELAEAKKWLRERVARLRAADEYVYHENPDLLTNNGALPNMVGTQ